MITFVNETSQRVAKKAITEWIVYVYKELKRRKVYIPTKKLVVVFVTERKMINLNFNYRGKKKPTDVLSFQSMEEDCLGELVLCSSVLLRQAKEHSLSFQEEVFYMLLHGILHLLGYDHEFNKKNEKIMFELQDSVWSQFLLKKSKLK